MGPGLELPVGVLGRKLAVLGMTGSGKTSTAVVLVEEAEAQGIPYAILDPTGAWTGIGTSADGEHPGLPVVIFGGEHGDAPLEASSGRAIAGLCASRALPGALLDLSGLTRSDQLRVAFEFADELYHRNREPLLVVVDEAHRFIPQNAGAGDRGGYGARCHRALVDLVTMGRRKGLGACLVTPRPAKLAKDAFELCDVLIAHRLRGTNDRKAVAAWLDDTDAEQAAGWLSELPRFEVGEALVSAPDLELAGRYRFREKATYDSSSSPIDSGRAAGAPTARAAVDLSAVRAALAEAIERQEQEDPEALRRQVAGLREQLAAAKDAPRAAKPVERDEYGRTPAEAERDDWQMRAHEAEEVAGSLREKLQAVRDVLEADTPRRAALATRSASRPSPGEGHEPAVHVPAGARRSEGTRDPPPVVSAADGTQTTPPAGEVKLKVGALRIAATLRRVHAVRPDGLSRDELSTLALVSAGGSMSNYLSQLRSRDLIVEPEGRIALSPRGMGFTSSEPESAPDAEAVIAPHVPKLKAGARRILDVLMRAPADGFTRKELEGLARVSAGGSMSNYLSQLRKRGLISERRRRIYPHPTIYIATGGTP